MVTRTHAKSRSPSSTASAVVDAGELSEILRCSKRHVLRLAERGLLPPPVKLGSLSRWSRPTIEAWIDAGCPAAATGKAVRHGR